MVSSNSRKLIYLLFNSYLLELDQVHLDSYQEIKESKDLHYTDMHA